MKFQKITAPLRLLNHLPVLKHNPLLKRWWISTWQTIRFLCSPMQGTVKPMWFIVVLTAILVGLIRI